MRTWTRATISSFCGGCGAEIKRGDPHVLISLPGVSRKLVRCPACAGPAPPDLPALIERSPTTKPFTPLKAIAKSLPFDSRMAAVGREPGSDDE
jgi:hypothetical protein